MRTRLLIGILAVSTSLLAAQVPATVAGVNPGSAETLIAASLAADQIGSYSKTPGLAEWVSDFKEFNSHLVEKYRARYDFRLEGNVLSISMRDLEEWGGDGWTRPMIAAKGAEQKLIAQMADRVISEQRILQASPPVAAMNGRTATPPPAPSGGLRIAMIPGSNPPPRPSETAGSEPAPTAPQQSAASVTSAAGYKPTIADISLGMPYGAAHKIGIGLYGPTQQQGLNFNAGDRLRGEAWAEDDGNATAVAANDNGQVDFVARERTYRNPAARPTWDNFRKALIAQYGPPSTENVSGWGDPFHTLYWYYDSEWHIVDAKSVPKECLSIEVSSPESWPYDAVKWLPYLLHQVCPVRLYAGVWSHDTLVTAYSTFMFDEPAAFRDSVAEMNQRKLEEEKKLKDAEKVKPTF